MFSKTFLYSCLLILPTSLFSHTITVVSLINDKMVAIDIDHKASVADLKQKIGEQYHQAKDHIHVFYQVYSFRSTTAMFLGQASIDEYEAGDQESLTHLMDIAAEDSLFLIKF